MVTISASASHSSSVARLANSRVPDQDVPAVALEVRLLSYWEERGEHYAAVALGSGSLAIRCPRAALRSFAKFSRFLLTERKIAAYSPHQSVGSHGVRRQAWLDEVRRAEKQGAAA